MATVGLCVKKRFGGDASKTCYCADCSPNPTSEVLERLQGNLEHFAGISDPIVAASDLREVLATIERLSAERLQLREALQDVVNPIGKLKRDAEAEGNRLSGMAYSIANDLSFVQSIARAALSNTAENGEGGQA